MILPGAKIIWETMLREGVETVFGYPGGGVLPIYDALLEYPIRHILARHEQGAVHMADGYARASGKVGVAIGTSGPGATNMVTGIATANLDSSPLVCITGQVAGTLLGFDAFQEVDTTGITMPITKHNYLVTDIEELGTVLKEAFHIARTGRPGPVLVDIPKDVQNAVTDWDYDRIALDLPGYNPSAVITPWETETLLRMLNESKRPLILAGQGILMGHAEEELRKFVETTQIPVAVTLLGIGALPAGHPLYLGMMGMHGDAWVNTAIQDCDLLLALGMRFDDRVTGTLQTYAPHARKIHIDIDQSEINKNVNVDLGIVSDLKTALRQVNGSLATMQHTDWVEQISDQKMDDETQEDEFLKNTGMLNAPQVIRDLWNLSNEDTIVVADVGQHQMWTAQYYKFENPRTLFTSGGLGTMGFSLPAGIGVKVARPESEVWVLAGDGGFQMTQAELSTITQENLKLNIAIINNGYLGMVRQWQDFFFEKRYSAVAITAPDFVKIADAHGLEGIRVTNRSEVAAAVEYARQSPHTVLIDFRVEEEDAVFPMVPSGASLESMIRRPKAKINK